MTMTYKIINADMRLECRAVKSAVSGTYYGQIRAFRIKAPVGFAWATSSYIDRLNKDDAMHDAKNLLDEAMAQNAVN